MHDTSMLNHLHRNGYTPNKRRAQQNIIKNVNQLPSNKHQTNDSIHDMVVIYELFTILESPTVCHDFTITGGGQHKVTPSFVEMLSYGQILIITLLHIDHKDKTKIKFIPYASEILV